MHVKYTCPRCGHVYYRPGIGGIPFWIIVGIPWIIGIVTIIQRIIS